MLQARTIRIGVTVVATMSLLLGPGLIATQGASGATSPKLTVTPSTGLKNGQTVIVRGSGFKPKDSVYLLECLRKAKGSAQCSVPGIPTPITISKKGIFPATKFTVTTGTVGSGSCGTKKTNLASCDLSVGNANGGDSQTAPITFKLK